MEPHTNTTGESAWRLRPAALVGAVLINVIPILGVLFGGWSAFALMLLYWLENVLIGLFNVMRMIASGIAHGSAGIGACLFIVPFFSFHYGMFCIVHGIFVFAMFGSDIAGLGAVNGPFDFVHVIGPLMAATPGLRAGFVSLFIWHAVLFLVFFLGRSEFRRIDPMSLMAAPYGRVIVLHLTIIGGGFFVMALGQPLAGILVLALLKTAFDLGYGFQPVRDGNAAEAWTKSRAMIAAAIKAGSSARTSRFPPPRE